MTIAIIIKVILDLVVVTLLNIMDFLTKSLMQKKNQQKVDLKLVNQWVDKHSSSVFIKIRLMKKNKDSKPCPSIAFSKMNLLRCVR